MIVRGWVGCLLGVCALLSLVCVVQCEPIQCDDRIFTVQELALYYYKNKEQVYVGLLGHVFDVTKARAQFSGPDLSKMTGTDSWRERVGIGFSGLYELKADNWSVLMKWRDTFREKYRCVGVVEGAFYNIDGEETEEKLFVDRMLEGKDRNLKDRSPKQPEDFKDVALLPPCTIQYIRSEETKTGAGDIMLSCTKVSGGIERTWEGMPRRYYVSDEEAEKCLCVPDQLLHHEYISPYDGSDLTATSVIFKERKNLIDYGHNAATEILKPAEKARTHKTEL